MPILELSRVDARPWRARALVFEAPVSRELLTNIEQLAPTDATVLITGETGTGKEIVARHLHDRSKREKSPFVAVNCGALTPSLLESELFGHERGAFTGATTSSEGWFEAAHKGTLFLDEVGDLPLGAQVKLLRVLQEREVVRVGARRAVAVDVRLIAATNMDLEKAVAERRFREDLYYRLHVAHLALAPLRHRREDILPLVRHFLTTYASRLDLGAVDLGEDAVAALLAHPWPGNIRELENVVHRALLSAGAGPVTARHLRLADRPAAPIAACLPEVKGSVSGNEGDEAGQNPRAVLEAALLALFEGDRPNLHGEIEEILFRTAYRFSDNNQLRTARLLGISRNVVRARLQQHGLLVPSSRADADSPASGPAWSLAAVDDRVIARWPGGGAKLSAVRVGYQHFGALSLLKVTSALEAALAGQDVEVRWTHCATGMQVVDALAAGALDLGVVGEVPPVFGQASSAPLVYLAAEPPAPEGEAIVVRESAKIATLADLRGRSLAVSQGANVLYFVVRALEEIGLGLDDVEIRALSPADGHAAFVGGEIDAWAIWNPILASVDHATRIRVLRDACGLAHNRAFYVARRAFADSHPDVVETFIGQVGAVGRWANASRELAASMLAPQMGLALPAVEAALARTPFDARPLDAEVIVAQQAIADTFHRLRIIARPVRVSDVVWAPPRDIRRSA